MQFSWIGFDADDTLWHNETIYHQVQQEFRELLQSWAEGNRVDETLFATETANMELYGYGIKAFTLSMLETALTLTDSTLDAKIIERILQMGRWMLDHPVELLPGAEAVLAEIAQKYSLLLITKGDLRDQQRKLSKSGLAGYFQRVEILPHKSSREYGEILRNAVCPAQEFIMIGNSLRSDILPVLEIGGSAVYIPYPLNWAHEHALAPEAGLTRFYELQNLAELPALLQSLTNEG